MAVETLRPNAAGDETSIAGQTPASTYHWDKVDEASADDGATNVNTTSTAYQRDLFNLAAHSEGSGSINFIKVYFRCCWYGQQGWAKPSLKSDSTVTDGNEVAVSQYATWTTYSQQWDTNPADSQAWEWADIDALQIGVSLKATSGGNIYCTQVYVEVDYTVGGETYDETGKLQVVLAAQGRSEIAIRNELAKTQTILAEQGKTDSATFAELGKSQDIIAAMGKSDLATFAETGKEQVILATLYGWAGSLFQEFLGQVILSAIGKSEQLILGETGKLQTILASLGRSDLATFNELGKLIDIPAITGGDAYRFYDETGKLQDILVPIGAVDNAIFSDVSKLQVILAALGKSDSAIFSETAKEQVILVVIIGDASPPVYDETGKLQLILAVVGKTEHFIHPVRALVYIIEVHDTSGNLLAILENATKPALTEELNRPPMLDFKLPADDSKLSYVTKENQIWLKNYETGEVVHKFILGRRRPRYGK